MGQSYFGGTFCPTQYWASVVVVNVNVMVTKLTMAEMNRKVIF